MKIACLCGCGRIAAVRGAARACYARLKAQGKLLLPKPHKTWRTPYKSMKDQYVKEKL